MSESICPICHSEAFDVIWRWQSISIGCCGVCGHVYGNTPDESESDYREFRQHYSDEFLLDSSNDLFDIARRRMGKISHTKGSMLEIGSAYGHFLSLMQAQGWQVMGVEPSVVEAQFARTHFAVNVHNQQFNEKNLPLKPASLDLVCVFHVLEHVPNPQLFMQRISSLLKDGSYCYLAVPNLLSLPRDFIEWLFIARGWHIHTFQPQHLVSLLYQNGFEIIEQGEEVGTVMSPSSYYVYARKTRVQHIETPQSDGCQWIQQYISDMQMQAKRLASFLQSSLRAGKKTALFGGGLHSQAVIELCDFDSNNIACIIDDDVSKQGMSIRGIPVVAASDVQVDQCSVIIVSTLASEVKLLPHLKNKWPDKQVVGIYSDILEESNL